VVLACRNLDKGNQARVQILGQAPQASVEVMALDLSSLASIRAFAKAYSARYDKLHLLINNAGVMAPPRQETADGFELQFGTNHLGHFALTGLLIALIAQTPGSRIVNITSSAQYFGKINFDDLQSEQAYSRYGAYNQSKLANVLFTFELQRRLEAAGVAALSAAAHPGLSTTNLQKNTVSVSKGRLERLLYGLMMPILAQGQAQGALPQLYAATMPDVKGGDHFAPNGFMEMRGYPTRKPAAKAAYNEADAKRLWEVSETLTGIRYLHPMEALQMA
jgi:NAD(P)-dependent dehydrogenase (short-subunit alcohol dehydrogenase family)